MIKPLSEQVAELEEERDRLKADAISDLIKRHWLENQVRNREAERDDLQRQVQEARDECDALPRVITADELREGQLICIHRGHSWGVRAIGEFQGVDGDVVTIKTGGSGTFSESTKFHTIVLLGEHPRPTGYADDDHQDAEVTQWHDPAPRTAETMRAAKESLGDWIDRINAAILPPRLTVPDLKVAPDWSVLHHRERRVYRIKHANYWWLSGEEDMSAPLTSEAAIANGWSDATLTTPEAQ